MKKEKKNGKTKKLEEKKQENKKKLKVIIVLNNKEYHQHVLVRLWSARAVPSVSHEWRHERKQHGKSV